MCASEWRLGAARRSSQRSTTNSCGMGRHTALESRSSRSVAVRSVCVVNGAECSFVCPAANRRARRAVLHPERSTIREL